MKGIYKVLEEEDRMKAKNQEKKGNKAGYTAETSRGRVGRGENARFQLERDGPTH